MMKDLDHMGIAVPNLEEALEFYQKVLGMRLEEIEEVPSEKVRVAILYSGESRVELLQPTSSDSPIAKFLEKRGGGVHHLAFAVSDIDEKVKELKKKSVTFIEPAPRPGAQNCKVAFIHPKSSGKTLLELVERKT